MGREEPRPLSTEAAIARVVREESGRVLASLVGTLRDFELAEDVLQDAYVEALSHWPVQGIPNQPAAWLLTTARRKAIDRIRRRANFEDKRAQLEYLVTVQAPGDAQMDEAIPDERLRLIFTCCHPALAKPARVALTLRTLGGLTTAEIARAFLTTEATMAQRLVRAQQKIKAAGIPYSVPEPAQWPERIDGVLAVIYFVFNEGYAVTSGTSLVREDLCREAIRLGDIMVRLAPDEPEAMGLLALMYLHHARAAARTDGEGNLVTLESQDRTRWDRESASKGLRCLNNAMRHRRPGPYQIQAAISALHAQADSHEATDWPQIAALYGRLHEFLPSPVVRLNGAVAKAFAESPEAGLAILDDRSMAAALQDYQPYHAARADLLRRAQRLSDAKTAYERAIALCQNDAERRYLETRLQEVRDSEQRQN